MMRTNFSGLHSFERHWLAERNSKQIEARHTIQIHGRRPVQHLDRFYLLLRGYRRGIAVAFVDPIEYLEVDDGLL